MIFLNIELTGRSKNEANRFNIKKNSHYILEQVQYSANNQFINVILRDNYASLGLTVIIIYSQQHQISLFIGNDLQT